MQKKGRKQLQKRLNKACFIYLSEKAARIEAEIKAEAAQVEAEYYKKRFRDLGSNVETLDPGAGCVAMLKWEIKPEQLANYVVTDDIGEEAEERLVQYIAKGLIENNLIQIIKKGPNEDCPLAKYGTIGGKLYVVPWEQMPHKRTLELRNFVKNTMEGRDG